MNVIEYKEACRVIEEGLMRYFGVESVDMFIGDLDSVRGEVMGDDFRVKVYYEGKVVIYDVKRRLGEEVEFEVHYELPDSPRVNFTGKRLAHPFTMQDLMEITRLAQENGLLKD